VSYTDTDQLLESATEAGYLIEDGNPSGDEIASAVAKALANLRDVRDLTLPSREKKDSELAGAAEVDLEDPEFTEGGDS
jgi:hypothetical protein